MLPEKWYVIRTKENHEKLNTWENEKQRSKDAFMEDKAYFFSDRYYTSSASAIKGYKEITWEEFETYVLNKETIYEIF